jgi:hypothetical protein
MMSATDDIPMSPMIAAMVDLLEPWKPKKTGMVSCLHPGSRIRRTMPPITFRLTAW